MNMSDEQKAVAGDTVEPSAEFAAGAHVGSMEKYMEMYIIGMFLILK